MWQVFFLLSWSAILLVAAWSAITNREKKSGSRMGRLLWTMCGGVAVAAFLAFIPVNVVHYGKNIAGVVQAVLISLMNVMQVFTVGCDLDEIRNAMGGCPEAWRTIYRILLALIMSIGPVFTFSFVMYLFRNFFASAKFWLSFFKDMYVFSELSEKSMALAADIRRNHKKAAIVFTDVFEENGEESYELLQRAKGIGAICFKKDILGVDFGRNSHSKLYFFTISQNETENLNQALKLIELYKNRAETHLYVFSTKVESEILLTSMQKGQMKVRRVNEVQSLVNRILYEQGQILFERARPAEEGMKHISALVIGMGNHGTEMLKALTWFCQMDGYRLEINAFDKDKNAGQRFRALAPELMSEKYNGVTIPGEAQYKISIHNEMDVETYDFAEAVQKIKNATYVFIALGNDDVNIRTAVDMRMYFERMGIHPVIHAVVYNSQQKNALDGIHNFKQQPYDIVFLGDTESSYTEKVILDSELENDALARHMKWGEEDEFWTYEYNYRSSVASAIHLRARIKCHIPGADKEDQQLTDVERVGIEALEHRRWNAYMRAEGYIYSGSKDKKSRNDLGKMHHDLVDYDSLSEEEKRKDSRVGTN